jgi:coproporphyrinogen III oxidase
MNKTIVYKGMLHAYQVGIFYDDLQDEDFAASIAVVHSRFYKYSIQFSNFAESESSSLYTSMP